MALKKAIELDNGVVVNYHRISNISTLVNKMIMITIVSYVNSDKRDEETAEKPPEESYLHDVNNVITTMSEEKEYEEGFDVVKAYEYLKSLDKFKDAEDA